MSEQSFINFEVREKIKHFKDGQSFNNLSSMELEPIVKVNQSKEKIEITGHLVLDSEFIKLTNDWSNQFEDSDGLHYGSIFEESYSTDKFQYQIPITFDLEPEIVEDPEGLLVVVENFDYEVLSDEEIELVANIKLLGVKSKKENIELAEINSQSLENNEEDAEKNPLYSLIKKEHKHIEETNKDVNENNDGPDINHLQEINENNDEEENTEKELEQSNENSDKEKMKSRIKTNETDKDNRDTKDMLYSLLKSDEETKYTLKIYFVKENDTLEEIAKRYNLKTDFIISFNKLESDQLEVGQLLYLPDKRMYKNVKH